MTFKQWLYEKKGLSDRVCCDIISRLNRIKSIMRVNNVNEKLLTKIETNQEFQALGISIKSQIRHSIRLFIEYKKATNND